MSDVHQAEDFQAYEQRYGHLHDEDLPLPIRQAYIAANLPFPQIQRNGCVTTPSPLGQCGHCGVPVPEGQHRMAHAVAGFEEAVALRDGKLLRMLIDHCEDCHRSDACSRDAVTPGSGWRTSRDAPGAGHVGAAGWCESLETAETIGMVLVPGAATFVRWGFRAMRWALAGTGLYLVASGMNTSRGIGTASLSGPLINLIDPGDATTAHGFNLGNLKVYSGTAPTGANAADQAEATPLLINWVLPQTAAASISAATPPAVSFTAISNVNAAASGTVTYARILANGDDGLLSTSERRIQLTTGAGSGELSFNTTTISSGGACSLPGTPPILITWGA